MALKIKNEYSFVFQEVTKRLSLPADIRLPGDFLARQSLSPDGQLSRRLRRKSLVSVTLKAPIMTAADDIHKYFFHCLSEKKDLMFQVNPLLGRGFT